jgi:3-oxoacyl-[acyl-carrier-protein] synthase II
LKEYHSFNRRFVLKVCKGTCTKSPDFERSMSIKMSRRVVVTGLGAITPIGLSVDEFWTSVKAGKVGFDKITKFDTSEYKCKLAAEVKGFEAKDFMDVKAGKRMELFSQYAVAATKEALEDAGIDMEKEDGFRVGVSMGSGIGSLQAMEREHTKLLEKGPGRVNPLLVPLMICNMAAGNVSIQFGLKGKNINVVTACATGTNSIGEAFRSIQYGEADVMVAGGTESSITPVGVAGFTALTALTSSEDKNRCSIPFDKERSGFVMGEGSAAVILEELEHAKKRGAKIYAEVVGYGCTADAYHITSPAEDGEGAAKAMEFAIGDAGIRPEDITYINAHGTSTHHNDLFETRAIKKAFGDHVRNIKINSTKSMVGHLLGAAGALEFVTCVKELEEGYIHRTVGYQIPDEECDLDYCKEAVEEAFTYALSNSLGFGGHNSTIIAKKYTE